MFHIVRTPIVAQVLEEAGAGGIATFEGKVRNRNDGREVKHLEYDCHFTLAEAEGSRILTAAVEKFGLIEAKAVHRVGTLEVGETAVWIAVAAGHRKEAFQACSYILEEVKARVPIWKREHYADGSSEWLGVQSGERAAEYHRRHASLPEIGRAGVAKLSRTRVLVVGAGGLGCAALPYLAGAGFGLIGVADSDTVDITNLQRQPLYSPSDVGKAKADLAARAVAHMNPWIEARALPHIDQASVDSILEGYDIVVDGTDRFDVKFLLNDACRRMGKPLVTASVHRYEGSILTVLPDPTAGCLRCIWSEAPADGCVGTCSEEGVLGALVGVFGSLQAAEAIQVALDGRGSLGESLMMMDLRDMSHRILRRHLSHECPVCGNGREAMAIHLTLGDANRGGMAVIDIREAHERRQHLGVPDAIAAPMSDPDRLLEVAERLHSPVALVCAHGIRSTQAAYWLRGQGIEAYSLAGGIEAISREAAP
ncbi:MAG: ThiF family adenylyltransferase [Fimbriimonadaceae bacterium]